MRTMEAFRSQLPTGTSNVLEQVTYISAGAILAPSALGLQVSATLSKLHSLFGVGANLENISPQAASMLPLPYSNYCPNNIGTALETPANFLDFSRPPNPLPPTQPFHLFASQT